MKKRLLTGSIWCFSLLAAAQSNVCALALDEAEQAFEQGRLLSILDEEENVDFYQCLIGKSFSKEEELRAHKLLAKVYLFTDNEYKADEEIINLLKINKEHQLSQEDPAELHFLYSQFRTKPIFRIAVRGGLNKTFITMIQSFNSFQEGQKQYNEKGNETGFGVGLSGELLVERYLGKGIEAGFGAQFRSTTYEVDGQIILENLTYIAKNRSSMLRAPLLLRYNFGYNKTDSEGNRKKLIPYVFIGTSFDITIDAKYVDTTRSGGTAFSLTDENNSLTNLDQVMPYNLSVFGGLGTKLRVGRSSVDFMTFELRYDNSLFNYINPENRWINDDVSLGIGHVEDDLTLNALTFSFGYTRSIYIPRKYK